MSPETALSRVTMDNLRRNFEINTFGPILVAKEFAPLLVKGAEAAQLSSIGDNRLGGWYSYRASKAALNQLNKSMALEFERRKQAVSCVLLHPGTCDTGLSKPFQKNVLPEKLFPVERAVQQLLGIVDGISMEHNGGFFAWDGLPIPW
eukprot:jgi/Botrbrau1/947/Bobra.0167s0056.3